MKFTLPSVQQEMEAFEVRHVDDSVGWWFSCWYYNGAHVIYILWVTFM